MIFRDIILINEPWYNPGLYYQNWYHCKVNYYPNVYRIAFRMDNSFLSNKNC